jgi:hypothetical protein
MTEPQRNEDRKAREEFCKGLQQSGRRLCHRISGTAFA